MAMAHQGDLQPPTDTAPVAVISDVHGNLPALRAVLADVDARGVSRIWCLGDTLGYGPYARECFALVAEHCEVVLAGNHDLAVRGDLSAASFGGTAGAGVAYAAQTLDEAGWTFLRTLTPTRLSADVELYHASAADPVWEYIRDADVATRHLSLQHAPISLVGHSHLQLAFGVPLGSPPGTPALGGGVQGGGELEITGRKVVLNPGSVGQPRDRDPHAGYGILRPGSMTFLRVAYDVASMHEAVAHAGLPGETADRLELGW